jgi:hypothetical protein
MGRVLMEILRPNTIIVIQHRIKWAEHVEHVEEKKTAHSIFMRKPEWNNPPAGARHR